MQSKHVLVIDDSLTVRKLVECHLSQAGYRVSTAPDADRGVQMAHSLRPDLILLDHQLPGITGDRVCRTLLESPETQMIPLLVSSSERTRIAPAYTPPEVFYNVVEFLHKPYTTDALKSVVANALEKGPAVVVAQKGGSAMPEMDAPPDALLQGMLSAFPLRAALDFVNNCKVAAKLVVTPANGMTVAFALASGRIQAVYSPHINPDAVAALLPKELEDLSPLLAITLSEQSDPQMGGLVKLLERSLSDPRRLRSLLKAQAAILTGWALSPDYAHGTFAVEASDGLPPMFQAFPLQSSLAALAVEGVQRCRAIDPEADWAGAVFARVTRPGANLDRAGMTPAEMKLHTLLDGNSGLATAAQQVGLPLPAAAAVASGLELAGLVERREPQGNSASVLVLEDDAEAVRVINQTLGPDGLGLQLKVVKDRVSAQLLLRRNKFDLVLLDLDGPDQETFYRSAKQSAPAARFVGLISLQDESELERLDQMGLDAIATRPLNESELVPTVKHVLGNGTGNGTSHQPLVAAGA
jgi:CheY-like chemotaxis protein